MSPPGRWMPAAGAAILACGTAAGCALVPTGGGAPAQDDRSAEGIPMPPPGYGGMTLDQLSLDLDSAGLRLKVTPLSERVIRAAAPDTYTRLHALQRTVMESEADSLTTGSLFLVSVFATTTARSFDPRLLTAASSARQLRPTRIVAITPGWTTRSVGSGMTESAIYRFDRRMELERDLTFVYGDLRSRSWASVAPQVEAELVRARARAGGEGPHSPNFRIFR